MLIEKDNGLGFSHIFSNNSIGLELFIKRTHNNYSKLLGFHRDVKRVSIKVNLTHWDNSLLYFEEQDERTKEYFLLKTVSVKKFLESGNSFMFIALPTIIDSMSSEKRTQIMVKTSLLNETEMLDIDRDIKSQFNLFLRETLRLKNYELIRFKEF